MQAGTASSRNAPGSSSSVRLEASQVSVLFGKVGAAFVFGSIRLGLPTLVAPRVEAREDPAGARQTRIHVRVEVPPLGTLLTYDGTMDLEGTPV